MAVRLQQRLGAHGIRSAIAGRVVRRHLHQLAQEFNLLRVRGLDNLWIADASVMPQIVPAMTNAAVVAIAERAAQLLVGQPAMRS